MHQSGAVGDLAKVRFWTTTAGGESDGSLDLGAPGAIPTRDLPLRRRTLYATELREHKRMNSKS